MKRLLSTAVAFGAMSVAMSGAQAKDIFALVPKNMNNPFFDQARDGWFTWSGYVWTRLSSDDLPTITHAHITGTGTRVLDDNGARAVADLFQRSFGAL